MSTWLGRPSHMHMPYTYKLSFSLQAYWPINPIMSRFFWPISLTMSRRLSSDEVSSERMKLVEL